MIGGSWLTQRCVGNYRVCCPGGLLKSESRRIMKQSQYILVKTTIFITYITIT